jgi:hypothetical protein
MMEKGRSLLARMTGTVPSPSQPRLHVSTLALLLSPVLPHAFKFLVPKYSMSALRRWLRCTKSDQGTNVPEQME